MAAGASRKQKPMQTKCPHCNRIDSFYKALDAIWCVECHKEVPRYSASPNDSRQTASDCVREPAPMAAGGDMKQEPKPRIETRRLLLHAADLLQTEAACLFRSFEIDGRWELTGEDDSDRDAWDAYQDLRSTEVGLRQLASSQYAATAASDVPPSGPQNLEPPAAIEALCGQRKVEEL